MESVLLHATHGKGVVRLIKVKKNGDVHRVKQLTVQLTLEAPPKAAWTAFHDGNNRHVVPTDTIKNTILVLSKKHQWTSIETFGEILCEHFLTRHAQNVSVCNVLIKEEEWQPLQVPDSVGVTRPHNHAFYSPNTKTRFTRVRGVCEVRGGVKCSITSGFEGFKVLKTTCTAFVGFCKDEYTTLPEATDRLLGTVLFAEWSYSEGGRVACYEAQAGEIEKLLIHTFAGPSDTGVHSPSVQTTLYEMGSAVLSRHPGVAQISLKMPNVHNLPLNPARLSVSGIVPGRDDEEVLVPTDEPRGLIEATLARPGASRL